MINLLSVRVPPNIVRQQLGKLVPMATNTHSTLEELMDSVVFMLCISFQILNI
jgi:hypothetical protein